MPKPLLITLAIVLLMVGGLAFYLSLKPKVNSDEAVLIINSGEIKRAFAGQVIEGMTIFDALLVSARAGNFDFNYQEDAFLKIGQLEENLKKWNVYLNGKKIENSPNEVFIKSQDKIEFQFE